MGKFNRADAASIAAHYGSVSVGTYAVAVSYMANLGIDYEEHMPLLLVVLEIPAIVVGILLAKGLSSGTNWKHISHEIFAGKGLASIYGATNLGQGLGAATGALFAGLLFDLTGDYNFGFLLCSMFTFLGAILFWTVPQIRYAQV